MSSVDQFRSAASHSSDVTITLQVDDREVPVAQLGPDFLILREQVRFRPTSGTVRVLVDGNGEEFDVVLPNGVDPEVSRTRIDKP